MGLLETLKLPSPQKPVKAGPGAGTASTAAKAPAAPATPATPEAPAEPKPTSDGRDAEAFETARRLRDGVKKELDDGWQEAIEIGRKLDVMLKVAFVAELKKIDGMRQKARRLDDDPPSQVVQMANALLGLKAARKAVGFPVADGAADNVAYDDGAGTTLEKSSAPEVAPELAAAAQTQADAAEAPAPAEDDKQRLSGAHWVAQFPTSRVTADLVSPFGGNCDAFIAAIETAGGNVRISATLRPKERAYLMHWAWQVGSAGSDPAKVPAEAGVDIEWDHGDKAASVKAAEEMIAGYGLAYKPSLTSRHIQGRAIDMTIDGIIGKTMKGKDDQDVAIDSAAKLHSVGAGYGVVKLVSDPPHWSDDGH